MGRMSHLNALFLSAQASEGGFWVLLLFAEPKKCEKKTPWVRSEGHVVSGFFSLWVFVFGCVVGTDESSQWGGTLLAAL